MIDLNQEYPFGGVVSLGQATNYLVEPVFYVATAAVTFYFIIGAVKWIASGGNKEAIASARNMITHAVVGFLLLILMFLVLQFIPQVFNLEFSIIQ